MESTRSVVPLYHQVYVLMRQQLSDGTFSVGKPMPSEAELAVQFNVSRITIRKSMERLEAEGRVSRQRGRGTFPLPQKGASKDSWLIQSDRSLGETTSIELLGYEVVVAQADVAQKLGLKPEEEVLKITRVRRSAKSPISYTICYLPAEFKKFIPKRKNESQPISVLLTKAGIELRYFHDYISATLADVEIAGHLEVDVGTALVTMTRTVKTEDGRIVQLLRALFRPDRFGYTVDYSAKDEAMRARWNSASG
jgi:GntR family transcriptional regulator